MYNHFMGGVDQADQLRSYYSTQHRHNKIWKALWHFLLDTTTINCYKIAYCSEEDPWGKPNNYRAYRQFLEAIYLSLFQQSERLPGKEHQLRTQLSTQIHRAPAHEHGEVEVLGIKHQEYLSCKQAGRKRTPGTTNQPTRKPLQELSINVKRGQKRRDRTSRSRYRCKFCNINLYGKQGVFSQDSLPSPHGVPLCQDMG